MDSTEKVTRLAATAMLVGIGAHPDTGEAMVYAMFPVGPGLFMSSWLDAKEAHELAAALDEKADALVAKREGMEVPR